MSSACACSACHNAGFNNQDLDTIKLSNEMLGELTQCMPVCREEAIIDIFERNTNSVANIFDITLQVRLAKWHALTLEQDYLSKLRQCR